MGYIEDRGGEYANEKTITTSFRIKKMVIDQLLKASKRYNFKPSFNQFVAQLLERSIKLGLADNLLGSIDISSLDESEAKSLLEQTYELAKDLGLSNQRDVAKLLSYKSSASYPSVLKYAKEISNKIKNDNKSD